jgi:hypothetical protein
MVPSDSLTTLPNLKAALKIANTADDAYLEQLIGRASWQVENDAKRKSDSGKYGLKARRYNGFTGGATTPGVHPTTSVPDEDYVFFSGSTQDRGGDTLADEHTGLGYVYLPAYPVQTNAASGVTFALEVLSSRSSSGGEAWDSTTHAEFGSYVVDREKGILRLLGGGFTPGFGNYRVTMAAGYQFGSNQPFVPPDLEQLCIEYCKKLWNEDEGVQSESMGTWSRTFDVAKSREKIDGMLSRYTRFTL